MLAVAQFTRALTEGGFLCHLVRLVEVGLRQAVPTPHTRKGLKHLLVSRSTLFGDAMPFQELLLLRLLAQQRLVGTSCAARGAGSEILTVTPGETAAGSRGVTPSQKHTCCIKS